MIEKNFKNLDEQVEIFKHKGMIITDERYARFEEKRRQIDEEIKRAENTNVAPTESVNALLSQYGSSPITTGVKLAELIRRPELSYEALLPIDPERPTLSRAVVLTAEINIKYAGYMKRQLLEVERARKLELKSIPDSIDYRAIPGLRLEAAEKLEAVRPANLGQASRISGVSPADIGVLMIRLGI